MTDPQPGDLVYVVQCDPGRYWAKRLPGSAHPGGCVGVLLEVWVDEPASLLPSPNPFLVDTRQEFGLSWVPEIRPATLEERAAYQLASGQAGQL